jgi:hypothetical protein
MATKTANYPRVGLRCRKCGEIIQGTPIPKGLHFWCIDCRIRCYKLISIMERLQRRERGVAS